MADSCKSRHLENPKKCKKDSAMDTDDLTTTPMPKKQSVEDVLKMVLDGDSSDLEFGEDDEDDDDEEEWTPTCTEGNSDSSDEEDLQDKSDDKTSGEVEDQTTIQDTTTK
ncbi:hypothetical protein AOLI_G00026050 [Acnodon oligacanthus]